MNEKLINDLLNNEEFKEKVSKVQSKEEYLKLFKEYSIEIAEEDKLKFINKNQTFSESGFVEVKDEELENVSGGKGIIDVIEEHTFTAFQCTECRYVKDRQGYWIPIIEECPRCHKNTFHAKQVYFW